MSDSGIYDPPPRIRRAPPLTTALARQCRIIVALFLRETRTRFGDSLLGYAWALIEPASNLIVWAALFSLFDRHPRLGDSMILFLATAFFPFMLFAKMSNQMMMAIKANRSLLQFPLVHNIDVIHARALLEVVTFIVVTVLYFSIFAAFGIQTVPARPLEALYVLALVALIGFGVGTVNAVMAYIFEFWSKTYPWINRAFYLTSGVFFLPAELPAGSATRDFASAFGARRRLVP
jgi:capsular polysaccharide transport system permease protein